MITRTWGIEDLRLTLIHAGGVIGTGAWEALTGEVPESQNAVPKQSTYLEHGPHADGVLSVVQRPQRHDIHFGIGAAGEPRTEDTLLAATVEDVTSTFLRLCMNWFPKIPFPVLRVAFGVIARMPTPDRESGYETLATYLPSVQLSTASQDFLYQINRRRSSRSAPGMMINRLSKWSAVQFLRHVGLVNPSAPFSLVPDGDPTYSCRAELDVNTVLQEGGPIAVLSNDAIMSFVPELNTLAVELLQVGDVP